MLPVPNQPRKPWKGVAVADYGRTVVLLEMSIQLLEDGTGLRRPGRERGE